MIPPSAGQGGPWVRGVSAPAQDAMLMVTLELAVPLWQGRVCDMSDWQLRERTRVCSDALTEHSGALMFLGKKTGSKHCADTFNRLAEGLAIGSLAPGGITFRGRHWTAERTPDAIERLFRRCFGGDGKI